ncbi:hypothetical protein BKA63DRAFT_97863 [Paraphoma chrysanthemicola]|nr:hypothetical protein BKA63DRAFT_97863 [Paraphoma chrysanthemicola]
MLKLPRTRIPKYYETASVISVIVRRAIEKSPGGPSRADLKIISQLTRSSTSECNKILAIIKEHLLKTLTLSPNRVLNALQVLDHCLRTGALLVVTWARKNRQHVRAWSRFTYVNGNRGDRETRHFAAGLYTLIDDETTLYIVRSDPPMSDQQFRLIYQTNKSIPLPGQNSPLSPYSGTTSGRPRARSREYDSTEAPPESFTPTEHSQQSHGQEEGQTHDRNGEGYFGGTLLYRAPGQGHLFVKCFAWFLGQNHSSYSVAATNSQIREFLESQNEEFALRVAHWCQYTQQHLLFLAKKNWGNRSAPLYR